MKRYSQVARCRWGAAGAVFAGVCFVAMAAWAQTIRIPDFRQPEPPATFTLKPGEPCHECGRIVSIREIRTERRPAAFQGSAAGPASGPSATPNLVGAVIYLPLGGQTPERPFVGGVGTPEMRERFRETTYEITVRLDDGTMRFIQRNDGTRFMTGDRVRLTTADGLELVAQ
ncbi:MAG: hypothetical protein KIT18_08025 [Burkholderiales bacterium]|nr:hypothetical protein [Burkholderiales bacterium]